MQRRDFIKWSVAHSVLATIPKKVDALEAPVRRTTPSVLQGATDESCTQFSVVFNRQEQLAVRAVDSKGVIHLPQNVEVFTCEDHPQAITKIYFSNLQPGETYQLELLSQLTGRRFDVRQFATLALDGDTIRFAVVSCMDDERHVGAIWHDLIAQQPDALFFIGDSVYVDKISRELSLRSPRYRFWARHCEARATLDIYYSKRLVPIFATWDDHDYGLNNGGRSFKYQATAYEAFISFFAQDSRFCRGLESGAGVSLALRARQQLFMLMDGRSFRAEGYSSERHALWGEAQENWMIAKVNSCSQLVWLMNGTQFFTQLPFVETMAGQHSRNFAGLIEQLRLSRSRVIFVSGDVHFSEISEIEPSLLGYPTLEITSSSMHSRSFPGTPLIAPNRRRVACTGQRNYILVESSAAGASGQMTVSSRSGYGTVNFCRSFYV